MKRYNMVLTIAGSDSGGGAGIQADIKTITSLGCYAASVISCLTAQNTVGVQAIQALSKSFVSKQLSSVLNDLSLQCIKIGMLYNKNIIDTVFDHLSVVKNIPIVLDPIMIATSKDILLQDKSLKTLIDKLFSLSTLLTPNIHEAETLIGSPIRNFSQMKSACKKIQEMGARNVIIKGGDLDSKTAVDVLLTSKNKFRSYRSEKISTLNSHGTGCSFSSAIASFLSRGHSLENSVSLSKIYILAAIKSGSKYKTGNGQGPINHMWRIHHESI